MSTAIPDQVKQLARQAAAEGARQAADILLENDSAVAYAGLEVDGSPVGAVLVVFDTISAARIIEFAATLGAVPVLPVAANAHVAPPRLVR